jgi:spore coat protein CotH
MTSSFLSRRQLLVRGASIVAVSQLPGAWSLLYGADKSLAEERKAYFAEGKIPKLSITIEKADVDSLRREPKKYVKAQIKEEGGKEYKDVAVHMKGAAGSFRSIDEKPGLTLNMNKFADGQYFHGLDKLHLNNSVQDPTYLTELFCGEMYRAAGVPASNGTHAIVTLNGRLLGFYFLKEGYDKTFLQTSFGNHNGNFYDGGFLKDLDQPLELQGSGGKDVKDQQELKAVAAAAREGDPAKRFSKLEKLLDMDRFISYLTLQVAQWDWDGYPMNRNNYRIYHDPTKDKVIFLPSGMDQMWGDPNGPLLPGFQGFVARGVVESPEGKKRYYARFREIMKDVYKVPEMLKRLDELEARIQPALKSVDKGAGNDYKNQVNRLRGAIPQRAKVLEEQLKKKG